MVPSVLVFFFELFLLEGLSEVAAEDSSLVGLVAFSDLPDFFEAFVPELDVPLVDSVADSPLVPVLFIVSSPWR